MIILKINFINSVGKVPKKKKQWEGWGLAWTPGCGRWDLLAMEGKNFRRP
jgi:hypothetical protein